MDICKEEMKNFIECAYDLGKELLDKETLTSKEEKFLQQLDKLAETLNSTKNEKEAK